MGSEDGIIEMLSEGSCRLKMYVGGMGKDAHRYSSDFSLCVSGEKPYLSRDELLVRGPILSNWFFNIKNYLTEKYDKTKLNDLGILKVLDDGIKKINDTLFLLRDKGIVVNRRNRV